MSRQTRAQQLVFVNGRAIESPVLHAALREGYHTALMKGQYPVTFIFIELDPGAVDVNVHPAKREVRFRDPAGVREAVVKRFAVRSKAGRQDWQQRFQSPIEPADAAATTSAPSFARQPTARAIRSGFGRAGGKNRFRHTMPMLAIEREELGLAARLVQRENDQAPAPTAHAAVSNHRRAEQTLRPDGEREGLVLVDQHAAHERILFEELRRRMEEQGVPSQRLLLPLLFDLAPRDAEWVDRNLPTLQKMGIGIEFFGQNTFKIDSLPTFLSASDPVQFIREVIDGLKSASDSSSPLRLGEDMIAKTVCRHAVKANDPLRYMEIEKLIRDLLECDLPYCCPHGRPTMIQISLAELEKKFGRKA